MSTAKNTYCNPLPFPQIPRGKDNWYKYERGMFSHENKPEAVTGPDYRSISDPTVFYHEGKWYLYPSYGMAWVSEDFATWKHHRSAPDEEFNIDYQTFDNAVCERVRLRIVAQNRKLGVGVVDLAVFGTHID